VIKIYGFVAPGLGVQVDIRARFIFGKKLQCPDDCRTCQTFSLMSGIG
jgi:hypothetical protein